ncbi:MAG: ABC transporter substrate-binding protein, partial [Acidimicrobiales bacterium]
MLAVLVALALVAAACGSSKKSDQTTGTTPDAATAAVEEGTPVDGGSLVVGIAAETNGWNPANDQIADTGSLVVSSVLEPLATVGADKGAKPWLADSWYPNTDFTSWVLKLHPGITFHNGEPFDAQAVVDNMEAYKKGTLSSLALGPMIGDSVVVDPLTVQINLKQPWAA